MKEKGFKAGRAFQKEPWSTPEVYKDSSKGNLSIQLNPIFEQKNVQMVEKSVYPTAKLAIQLKCK
ncbi:MAG TPA: hypothetical protein ENJ82_09785 [Bacteroidetes bacterium]|nr:hypothetical protein [Bacteroidota bacterium]